MHEGRGYRYTFQRARVASSPEVPKVTWWKIATFLGYHLHWLTSLETSRHFRKIALRLGILLAMFRECLCVVARQLAPKCRDFSNVAKLARQCKWPSCLASEQVRLDYRTSTSPLVWLHPSRQLAFHHHWMLVEVCPLIAGHRQPLKFHVLVTIPGYYFLSFFVWLCVCVGGGGWEEELWEWNIVHHGNRISTCSHGFENGYQAIITWSKLKDRSIWILPSIVLPCTVSVIGYENC